MFIYRPLKRPATRLQLFHVKRLLGSDTYRVLPTVTGKSGGCERAACAPMRVAATRADKSD